MKQSLILISFLFISACSLPSSQPQLTAKTSIPIGSVLQLTKTIEIPADREFMYIANGEVKKLKNYNTVNIYYPYCTIHLESDSPQARQITPDQFKVTKIVEMERDYGSLFRKKYQLVNHNGFIKTSMGSSPGPSIVMYATIIHLKSTKQPEVTKLVCGHWNDSWEIAPLTLKEIKTALGSLIVIPSN